MCQVWVCGAAVMFFVRELFADVVCLVWWKLSGLAKPPTKVRSFTRSFVPSFHVPTNYKKKSCAILKTDFSTGGVGVA